LVTIQLHCRRSPAARRRTCRTHPSWMSGTLRLCGESRDAPFMFAPPPMIRHFPHAVLHPVHEIGNVLQALVDASPGVLGTVLARADGRVLAHAGRPDHAFDPVRSAAVATSLLALSESFARESLGSPASYSSIATDRGTLVLVRVP